MHVISTDTLVENPVVAAWVSHSLEVLEEGARGQGLPITPQAPWHGYSLGDWDEHYDIYARRAVEGRWAESGNETIKRRRGGLTPETPARDVEGAPKKSK